MGNRLFVAIRPPESFIEALAQFLEPRSRSAGVDFPWIASEQWHLTLAFFESVPDHRVEDLTQAVASAVSKTSPFVMRIGGACTFPDPSRAKVLWLGVDPTAVESLSALATSVRNHANRNGMTPDGTRFIPHVTLARLRRPIEATRWLRILDAFESEAFTVENVELIQSRLGEGPHGRPRHEVLETFALSATAEQT